MTRGSLKSRKRLKCKCNQESHHVFYTINNVWIDQTKITLYAIMSLRQGAQDWSLHICFSRTDWNSEWVSNSWCHYALGEAYLYSASTLGYMTFSGYPGHSTEYKKCLKPSSGQHHPITPRLFASTSATTRYYHPVFWKNTVEFTPGVLPMFPWDLIDRFETSEGFLQVIRQRSHQLLSSHQIGWWDGCLVHGFFKIATLQCWGDVYGCSSRPSYIDHSLIDKDALGGNPDTWSTESYANLMLKTFQKKLWRMKCLPYEQMKAKCILYVCILGSCTGSKAIFFEFFLAGAHHETLRNGGHVLRELQGASNASSLQPRNVDQHVQKLRLSPLLSSDRFSGFHRILIALSQTTWWNTW